jgi:putative transposase
MHEYIVCPCPHVKITTELAIQGQGHMKKCTTFEELLKPLTGQLIAETVNRHKADYYAKRFKTWDHLITLLYVQLQDIKSLRDIEISCQSQRLLKLLGCTEVKRSTLGDANQRRPAACMLWIAEQLMWLLPRRKRHELNKIVRKLDSSPIQLKGRGYDDWTKENRTLRCQGLKLHIEYDSELNGPVRSQISAANLDDCRMGQQWPLVADTIYVFDKGYYDFNWWWQIQEQGGFFVTRLKKNAAIKVTQSLACTHETILEDGLCVFTNKCARGGKKNLYAQPLRRTVVKREGKKPLVLISNLVEIPAEVISELYKERWDIELFFKWIKQNLRIKKFLGRSENAVKMQLAAALIAYLLILLLKLTVKHSLSLHQLLIWIRSHGSEKKEADRRVKPPTYPFQSAKPSVGGTL